MDLIWTMPGQEITILNMTSPWHTSFLTKPLPAIVNQIVRPNITLISPPSKQLLFFSLYYQEGLLISWANDQGSHSCASRDPLWTIWTPFRYTLKMTIGSDQNVDTEVWIILIPTRNIFILITNPTTCIFHLAIYETVLTFQNNSLPTWLNTIIMWCITTKGTLCLFLTNMRFLHYLRDNWTSFPMTPNL